MRKSARVGKPIQPDVGAEYVTLTEGIGVRVRDGPGRDYLDAAAGVGVVSLGYGRRDIVEALAAQAARLPYAHSMRFGNESQTALAQRLATITPDGIDWFFFCSGGSEALDSALKIVRQYWLDRGEPRRWKVIGRRPSFHGNTLAALSVGFHAARRSRYLPYLIPMPHLEAPWIYRCDRHGPDGPYCDVCSGEALAELLDAEGPDTVAAFIAEPIVGAAAPGLTPPAGYYQTIRTICDRHGVLFISDEVMTGIGRTGLDFGIDHWGVVPDLMIMAKGIASGYAALAAVGVHRRVIDTIRGLQGQIEHNFTMAGNPLACAVRDAVLTAYVNEGIAGNAARMGAALEDGLRRLRAVDIVGDVRGRGLMFGVELTRPGTRDPFPPEVMAARSLDALAREEGLLIYPCSGIVDGVQGDAILLLPPLVIDEGEVSELIEKLGKALSRLQDALH